MSSKGNPKVQVRIPSGQTLSRRFPPGTPRRTITAWKVHAREKLEKLYPVGSLPKPTGKARSLFPADVVAYLPLVKTLASWRHRRGEIRHWLPFFSDKHRDAITQQDILRVQGIWTEAGVNPKTINNRVGALRDLFHKLAGSKTAPTPCDGVGWLKPKKVVIPDIPADIVNRTAENLLARAELPYVRGKGRPAPYALQDRARLLVLASTGKRPCELERALPTDVDMVRRVWTVRDAKGGWSPGLYLNDEMLYAWRAFIEADAWGAFPAHFPRRLRDAGWPDGVKPYALRHAIWTHASEQGNDLADISAGLGHKRMATARESYVKVRNSRMQKMSESMNGRFGWKTA